MRLAAKPVGAVLLFLGFQSAAAQSMPLAKTIDREHHSVVAILRVDSSGQPLMVGSGVVIHPRVVLTAGHVILDEAREAPGGARAEGFVALGENALDPDARYQFRWLDDVVSHPETGAFWESLADTTGLMDPWAFADIGLVFPRTPIENRIPARLPSPHALMPRSVDDSLVGAGYGYHMVPDSTFGDELVDGLRRKWSVQRATLVNDLWLSASCDSVRSLTYIGPFDSGAPLFMGDDVVVGIWSGWAPAEETCPFSSAAVRIDSPAVLEWIRGRVRERLGVELMDVDTPSGETPQRESGSTGATGSRQASSHN